MTVDEQVGVARATRARASRSAATPRSRPTIAPGRAPDRRTAGTDRVGPGARSGRPGRRGRRARARRAEPPTRCRAPRRSRPRRRARRELGHTVGGRRLAAHCDRGQHPRRGLGVEHAGCQRREVGERCARRRHRCAERHGHVGEHRPRGRRTRVDPAVGGAQERRTAGPRRPRRERTWRSAPGRATVGQRSRRADPANATSAAIGRSRRRHARSAAHVHEPREPRAAASRRTRRCPRRDRRWSRSGD